MKRLPVIVFFFIALCALCSGAQSYHRANRLIAADVNRALTMTLRSQSAARIDADTLQAYRNHISIDAVRDTATIALCTVSRNGQTQTKLVAEARCSFATVLLLSDQRTSAALLTIALLWLLASTLWMRRHNSLTADGLAYGGLVFQPAKGRFIGEDGRVVRLSPMQQELLEMFFLADDHLVAKQAICDRLWPKKPDASDTLYTLVRRMKTIIASQSSLRIESDRGRSYRLVDSRLD